MKVIVPLKRVIDYNVKVSAISDEVVALERRPSGCEFKDIHASVAGCRSDLAATPGRFGQREVR